MVGGSTAEVIICREVLKNINNKTFWFNFVKNIKIKKYGRKEGGNFEAEGFLPCEDGSIDRAHEPQRRPSIPLLRSLETSKRSVLGL